MTASIKIGSVQKAWGGWKWVFNEVTFYVGKEGTELCVKAIERLCLYVTM